MPDRTFGWIQDPGELAKLRQVVEIFDHETATHKQLVENRIPMLITSNGDRARLLNALATRPVCMSYADLKGQALGGPRANDPCNGIVPALLPGQRRPYMSDWAAENFVRWAHSLGFIDYDAASDTFMLASLGREYIEQPATNGINDVLEKALLSYPPAVRVMRLLAPDKHLTKFEIGSRLGFAGESGFTSLPQNLLIRDLTLQADVVLRQKMLSDWDGTSDKYARMIASWLEQVGWVARVPKSVTVTFANRDYTYVIPQAYTLTGKGWSALQRANGASKHARTVKNVYFEMLATKAGSRRYLRVRRALIIQALEGKGIRTLAQISAFLKAKGLDVNVAAVEDDIIGLQNIGLDIEQRGKDYRLNDNIAKLNVPPFGIADTLPDDVQQLKDEVRSRLNKVPHERLVLIDLSFDSIQNRLFEQETVALMLLCGFKVAARIGGADRPDGVAYTENLMSNYGLIIDSKAYSAGFSCSADQRREMQNYIEENIKRPANHPTIWWQDYPTTLQAPTDFRFLFVTSRFIGGFHGQFQRLSDITTDSLGAGITAANLLLYADALLDGQFSLERGREHFACLDEVKDIDTLT